MKPKQNKKIPTLVKIALFCFALYAAVNLVQIQLHISEKNARIAELNAQIETKSTENAALSDSVQKGATDDEIAAIAREKLGYAYPQERVFVDASSK